MENLRAEQRQNQANLNQRRIYSWSTPAQQRLHFSGAHKEDVDQRHTRGSENGGWYGGRQGRRPGACECHGEGGRDQRKTINPRQLDYVDEGCVQNFRRRVWAQGVQDTKERICTMGYVYSGRVYQIGEDDQAFLEQGIRLRQLAQQEGAGHPVHRLEEDTHRNGL